MDTTLIFLLGVALLAGVLFGAGVMSSYQRRRLFLMEGHYREARRQLEDSLLQIQSLREELRNTQHDQTKAQTRLEMQQQQQREFEEQVDNIAHRIIRASSQELTTQSHKTLHDAVLPIRERLMEFDKLIRDSFSTHDKEQHQLKHEIQRMSGMSHQLSTQANNLTRALQGNVRLQGNWGEVMLERVLQKSGLRETEDYVLQGRGMKLTDTSGAKQKPDVLVKLPDDKFIVIDAKVSLIHYEAYSNSSEDPENDKEKHLRLFVESVRAHIRDLGKRNYHRSASLRSPEFTLMFMPIESAYALAVQQFPDLYDEAWANQVVISTPSNLFSNLRTIHSLWQIERQNRNAELIAESGGKLYDKIVSFTEEMLKLGRNLDTTRATFDSALTKMSQGRGNMLTQSENLRNLGVSVKKPLPSELKNRDGCDHHLSYDLVPQEEHSQQAKNIHDEDVLASNQPLHF